ncbi:MAG: hypothetical protein ACRCXZ_10805 [Patescibacteria group bacterium]
MDIVNILFENFLRLLSLALTAFLTVTGLPIFQDTLELYLPEKAMVPILTYVVGIPLLIIFGFLIQIVILNFLVVILGLFNQIGVLIKEILFKKVDK